LGLPVEFANGRRKEDAVEFGKVGTVEQARLAAGYPLQSDQNIAQIKNIA
jgi:hypothetical protein